jgi:hypothetical protein
VAAVWEEVIVEEEPSSSSSSSEEESEEESEVAGVATAAEDRDFVDVDVCRIGVSVNLQNCFFLLSSPRKHPLFWISHVLNFVFL